MKVTYISHSGFLVELEKHVLLFDYFRGVIPEFPKDKEFLVFASHRHYDHFVKEIFALKEQCENIHYILSSDTQTAAEKLLKDPERKKRITFIDPDRKIQVGETTIQTLRSTDEGVAFVAECEGMKVYHAGDLNWWHWEGESEGFNEKMKEAYLKELKKLQNISLDLAFIPVDPRLGKQYYYGIDAFARMVDVKKLVPMHFWGEYSVCEALYHQPETKEYRDKIYKISREGEVICRI